MGEWLSILFCRSNSVQKIDSTVLVEICQMPHSRSTIKVNNNKEYVKKSWWQSDTPVRDALIRNFLIKENFKLFKNSEYFCMYEKAFLECSNYLFETLFKTTLGTFAGAKLIYIMYTMLYYIKVVISDPRHTQCSSLTEAR